VEALKLARISKRFGHRIAVRKADVTFATGRVHAVVGENGAGKSTLLKIAAGLLEPDTGEVLVEGARLVPHRAAEALRRGVGMVQQHFALVPTFTVLENLVLGAEPRGRFGIAPERVHAAAVRAFEQIGVQVPFDVPVADLGVGDRQRVEIARILFRGARTLILDEPTAVLTAREAEALYAKLRVLAGAGCAVIVVTHKLDEVLNHADIVTVMRRGEVVETRGLRRAERQQEATALSRAIMGVEPPPPPARVQRAAGEPVLALEGVTHGTSLRDVSFNVLEGEVVGIAGVEGNGQDELVRVIGGLLTPDRGRVVALGGVAIVYGDRHREGLVLSATVLDNLLLGDLEKFSIAGVLRPNAVRRAAAARRDHVRVTPPDLDGIAGELSGGNQQKIVVARALARADAGARALVLAHPTRGVDLGAARTIHDLVRKTVQQRPVGALVLSADLDELRVLCNRLFVINRGRLVAALSPDASDVAIGEHMLGTAGGVAVP
jgi:simple sugar transport system ATP-binding protein